MIQIAGLEQSFGATHALRGIDLQIADGESLTILGPNAAGKTTLLRILATLLRPTRGAVLLDGVPLAHGDPAARRQIGYLADRPLIYPHLSVQENLELFGKLYGVHPLQERVRQLLEATGLQERRFDMAGVLSLGLRQRLSFARSIIHQPPVLLLDEPFVGLDPEAMRILHDLLQQMADPLQIVIMATHDLQQGLELGTRVVILAQGRIAYQAKSTSMTLPELYDAYWRHAKGDKPEQCST